MKFLSLVGNSFGCSASGERLVSAARDGDILEAKALLEYNPRLARYSTFGALNSPLHYSSAQGHHEIVSLLLQSGVEINLRNYRGQTALMQACQHGHWEVVLVLILFKANIHRMDYLNGGTALHLAALNGHSRCIRLLLADYIPSVPDFWNMLTKKSGSNKKQIPKYETNHQSSYITALSEVINKPADGGITALHMAALNGHVETVQLLLDLGALVSKVTVEDGTTIDLIGAGSTALHYAACGGNSQCCRMLIARGASLTAENANGWTPLMVARSWHRDCLEEVLSARSEAEEEDLKAVPSPYSWLPLMSIIKIARECGWRYNDSLLSCQDPCVVCLERKCSVAAEGCEHEFCTNCALYLCSTNCCSISTNSPPGSIACPLCRNGIVSFLKLAETRPIYKENSSNSARTSLSLSFCPCTGETSSFSESTSLTTPFCDNRNRFHSARVLSPSFRSLSCQRLRSMKNVNSSLCMGGSDICPSLIPPTCSSSNWNLRDHFARCSRSRCRRSSSQSEARRSSWLSSLNHCVTTGN